MTWGLQPLDMAGKPGGDGRENFPQGRDAWNPREDEMMTYP